MAYYNALMKGGRVTRNRIKNEEEPPAADSKKTDKAALQKKLLQKKPQQKSQKQAEVPEPKKREDKVNTKEAYAVKLAQAKE